MHRRRKYGVKEAIEAYPVSLFMFDALYANGNANEILGYSFKEMAAMTTIDYMAPEERPPIGRIINSWRRSRAP
jgi:PAS domain-containing protein